MPETNLYAINQLLQSELSRRNLAQVSAVEAAKWLEAAHLLADSADKPGRPLRDLLRAGKIVGQQQKMNRRWYIHRASADITPPPATARTLK